MIEFDCPQCGKHLRVSEKYSGQAGKCQGCGNRMEVPTGITFPQFSAPRQKEAPYGTAIPGVQAEEGDAEASVNLGFCDPPGAGRQWHASREMSDTQSAAPKTVNVSQRPEIRTSDSTNGSMTTRILAGVAGVPLFFAGIALLILGWVGIKEEYSLLLGVLILPGFMVGGIAMALLTYAQGGRAAFKKEFGDGHAYVPLEQAFVPTRSPHATAPSNVSDKKPTENTYVRRVTGVILALLGGGMLYSGAHLLADMGTLGSLGTLLAVLGIPVLGLGVHLMSRPKSGY